MTAQLHSGRVLIAKSVCPGRFEEVHIMPEELGQEILNYIVERPYKEVLTLVMKLQSMKPEEKPKVVAAET